MKKRIYLIIYMVAIMLQVHAQNESMRQVYDQAESEYQIGRLDQAIDLLQTHINNFQGNLKQNAYRLMSLCYLAEDSLRQTEDYAMLLLKENPYYTSVNDPIRFEEIISRLRSGTRATITTASNQAETLDEVPVPVILITQEMIKDVGAKNLLEVLTAYVPGITTIESTTELNFAMRGVYKSGQQSVLIMEDGHRINSYSTHTAAPDYGINLDKVKQIEVLRGPASSLYGNVALTGVINIITKDGHDVDGVQLSYGMGNYNQYKGNVLFGKHYADIDVTGWASLYTSKGETFFETTEESHGLIPLSGDVILHRYSKKPSVDLGFRFKWNDFYAFYTYQYAKQVPSYSMDVFQAPYSYDKYELFNGQSPGHSHSSHKGEIGYQKTFGDLSLKASLCYDADVNNNYDIAGDVIPPVMGFNIEGTDTIIYPTDGCYQIMTWNDYHFEGNISASYNYSIKGSKGSILVGGQYEKYELTDNVLNLGWKFNHILWTTNEDNAYMKTGSENGLSAYFQIKQTYKNFIFNVGLRFDHRKRFNDNTKEALSPRIAIIYARNKWNMKFSFNRAFVDASYFMRSNTLPTYKGAEDLSPEYMNSFQYTFNYHFNPSLNYEINFFYNDMKDIIYYNSATSAEGSAYSNAGSYKACGIENILSYQTSSFRGMFNATWQHAISAENYVTTDHRVNNVPKLSYNIILSKRLFERSEHELWLHANAQGLSKQISYVSAFPGMENDEYIDVPARFIVGCGFDYKWKRLAISANVHNLFNKQYQQGGTSRSPIKQNGRWFLGTITLTL